MRQKAAGRIGSNLPQCVRAVRTNSIESAAMRHVRFVPDSIDLPQCVGRSSIYFDRTARTQERRRLGRFKARGSDALRQ